MPKSTLVHKDWPCQYQCIHYQLRSDLYSTSIYVHKKAITWGPQTQKVTGLSKYMYMYKVLQFSVPHIEWVPTRGQYLKRESSCLLSVDSCHGTTIVTSDYTIVTSGYHDNIRTFISNNSTIWQNNSITQKTCNTKYTSLPFLLLPPQSDVTIVVAW